MHVAEITVKAEFKDGQRLTAQLVSKAAIHDPKTSKC